MIVEKQVKITEEDTNLRLDIFLSKYYPHISRNQWQERIKAGLVNINGKKTKSSYILKQEDIIHFYYQKKEEAKVNTNYRIIYEDEDLLVIDKPSNLPVHPSGNYKNNTLYSILKQKYQYNYCHPIHRLDRETSGLIVFGKNPETISIMNKLFQSHYVQKYYYVLVMGEFKESKIIYGYIGKHFHSNVLKRQLFIPFENLNYYLNLFKNDYNEGCEYFSFFINNTNYIFRFAKTQFIPEKIVKINHDLYSNITLLKAKLFTGRTHQIRATLRDTGFPVVGDTIYGLDENYFLKFLDNELTEEEIKKNLILNRCALHSAELYFMHPKKNIYLNFKSDLPEDFQTLLK